MKLLSILAGLVALTTLANGQQVVTITAPPYVYPHPGSNTLEIAEGESVEVIGVGPLYKTVYLNVWKDGGIVESFHFENFLQRGGDTGERYRDARKFGGPCTLVLLSYESFINSNQRAYASLEISPGQYPPGKSVVIGERDGPMKCTLEESTDLVNWTQSTSGQTHTLTNQNAKKFFRIKLEQDVSP